ADYDAMSDAKRAYWAAKKDWMLIECSPIDIVGEGVESFLTRLKARLEDQGIPCMRLSDDAIWSRVRDRAVDRLPTTMVGFVGRCRKQSLSPSDLTRLIDRYSPLSRVEDLFLTLAQRLYNAYLDRLAAMDEEDFDGLMMRAAEAVQTGHTVFQRQCGSG